MSDSENSQASDGFFVPGKHGSQDENPDPYLYDERAEKHLPVVTIKLGKRNSECRITPTRKSIGGVSTRSGTSGRVAKARKSTGQVQTKTLTEKTRKSNNVKGYLRGPQLRPKTNRQGGKPTR